MRQQQLQSKPWEQNELSRGILFGGDLHNYFRSAMEPSKYRVSKYNLAKEPYIPYVPNWPLATDHLSSAIGKARSFKHIAQFIDLEAVMKSVEQLLSFIEFSMIGIVALFGGIVPRFHKM